MLGVGSRVSGHSSLEGGDVESSPGARIELPGGVGLEAQ